MARLTLPSLLLFTLSAPALLAQNNTQSDYSLADIPYGLEFLTQYRSEYNDRGFTLADDTLDLQLAANYAFNSTTSLDAAVWYAAEVGDGDFTEVGVLADLQKQIDQWTLSLSAGYRSYSNSFFEDGSNIQAAAFYQWNTAFESSARIAYDTGAEGWYSDIASSYYHRLNDHAYLVLDLGVSFVDDYYTRSGANDAFGKISFTQNINQSLSITPYLGASLLLDDYESASDSYYGGIYLAVSF